MAKRGFQFNDAFFKVPQYNRFDLSHDVKKTFNAGDLIPLTWWEGLPGDRFKVKVNSIVRTLALNSPMFQRQDMRIRIFKVALEDIVSYDDLQRAFTGGPDGNRIDFPFFELLPVNMTVGSLYDYLGLPLPYLYNDDGTIDFIGAEAENSPQVSAFPFLAYHRIYNDHFRNEETEDEVCLDMRDTLGFGSSFSELAYLDPNSNYLRSYNGRVLYAIDELHKVGWERDYFTSALKSTQRGNQVFVPLAGEAPVKVDSIQGLGTGQGAAGFNLQSSALSGSHGTSTVQINGVGSSTKTNLKLIGTADLSGISGVGAIALRMAMNLQALLEKFNISGYRMDEQDYALFGVHTGDGKKHYAVCCGGVEVPIQVSEVTQTSQSTDSSQLGDLAGKGKGTISKPLADIFCERRCIIMAVACIMPNSSYGTQGLSKKWTRHNYLDYFIPELQTIGEQEILNQELVYEWSAEDNEDVWAYQSRYSEYKYFPDEIGGDFRTSLSYWHQARFFTEIPAFNNDFIKGDPSDRIFAVSDEVTTQHYVGWFNFDIKAARKMAKYNISKLW